MRKVFRDWSIVDMFSGINLLKYAKIDRLKNTDQNVAEQLK